jgi:2-phospho-L-lactate transferase/gluconeogenesis factor (CofD/UPF0052 family)
MQQANESLGMTASQHLMALREHAGGRVFDYALVNTAPVSASVAARYRQLGCEQVPCDKAAIEKLGVKCVEGDFLEEADVVRHNTNAVARKILQIGRMPLAQAANA